ncbi:MAG: acyl carrier protein [Eubacterium sp.]|nr:acyl carrier protein [Eubacterium sp.]
MNAMFDKMREIIAEQLGVEEDEISLDTSFKEDLGADSLDLFELTMALEDEYDIEIPAEELESIETIGDVIRYLNSKGIED